jgi:Protein of unknown function (DUF2934)
MKPDSEMQKYPVNVSPTPARANFNHHIQKKININKKQKSTLSNPLNKLVDNVNRQQWISEAAYYKAKARGFTPGHDASDWLDAEQEYIATLVDLLLSACKEDGEITITGLRQLAKAIGIAKPEKIDSKTKLIRLIQTASHQHPCFRSTFGELCENLAACQWSSECQKLVAEWHR